MNYSDDVQLHTLLQVFAICTRDERHSNWQETMHWLEQYKSLAQNAITLLQERHNWRLAVDHEMVITETGCTKPTDNPVQAIRKVIDWNVQVALDPAVSSDAQKLFNAGYNKAVRDAINGELDIEGYLDV